MADNEQIVQDLVFEVDDSNFIPGLNRVIKSLDIMVNNASNIMSKVGQNFVTLHQQFTDSMRVMATGTYKEIDTKIASIKANLGKVAQDTNQFLREENNLTSGIVKNLREIDQLSNKINIAKATAKHNIAIIQEKVFSGIYSRKEGSTLVTEINQQTQQTIDNIYKSIRQKENETYDLQSKSSTNTIKRISENTEASSKNLISSLTSLRNQISSNIAKTVKEADITKAIPAFVSGKEAYIQQKREIQDLNNYIKDMDKQRVVTAKETETSLNMWRKQSDETLKVQAYDRYVANVENLNKLTNLRKSAEDKLRSLATVYGEGGLTFVKPAYGKQLGTDLISRFQTQVQEYKNNLELVGKLQTEIQQKVASGQDIGNISAKYGEVQNTLRKLETELNNSVDLMKLLGSTGISSARDSVGGMKNMISTLHELSKEYEKVYEYQTKIGYSGPLLKSQQMLEKYSKKAENLTTKYAEASNKIFDVSIPSGLEGSYKNLNDLKNIEDQKKIFIRDIEKEITKLKNEENKVRLQSFKETNAQQKVIMETYINDIIQQQNKLKNLKGGINFGVGTENIGTYEKVVNQNIENYLSSKMTSWHKIDQYKKDVVKYYEDITKYSTRSGEKYLEMSKNAQTAFTKVNGELSKNREEIRETINMLKNLSKMGFNVGNTISDLNKLKTSYDDLKNVASHNMNSISGMVRRQAQEQNKTWYSSIMETVRLFRWQYAAIGYIIQEAVSFVLRHFKGMFEEISKFRIDTYALVGTFGVALGDNFKGNFESVYNFSRDLMEKLQIKAATTYAKLEDMQMVLRSFVQGGIFPKTDKDIENIATISTAVKTLTEGMANAGVQMRQEVMAMIEGRSRATDTVARMLKMSVGDLNKIMDDWGQKGISRLEGFAKLLESFAEVNKHITHEYQKQFDLVGEIWKYLKRIAGERYMVNFVAPSLEEFNKSIIGELGKESTLKKFGEQIVTVMRTWDVLFTEFLINIKDIGKSIFEMFYSIGQIIGGMLSVFARDKSLSVWASALEVILDIMTLISQTLVGVFSMFKAVFNTINAIVLSVRSLIRYLSFDLVGAAESFKSAWESIKEANPFNWGVKIYENMKIGLEKNSKLVKDLDKGSLESSKNNLDVAMNLLNQGEVLKKTNDLITQMQTQIDKNKSKEEKSEDRIKKFTEAIYGSEGIGGAIQELNNKIKEGEESLATSTKIMGLEIESQMLTTSNVMVEINEEFENSIKQLSKNTSKETIKTIYDTLSFWQKAKIMFTTFAPSEMGTTEYDPWKYLKESMTKIENPVEIKVNKYSDKMIKKNEEIKKQIEDLKKQKSDIENKYEEFIKSEQDYQTRGKKTPIDQWKEYIGFLEKLNRINPFEKLKYSMWETFAELDKLAQDNDFIRGNYGKLQTDIWAKYVNDVKKLEAEKAEAIESFTKEAFGRETTDIEQIDEKFKKLAATLDELAIRWGLNAEQVKILNASMDRGKALAYQRLQVEQQKALLAIQKETTNSQIELLSRSIVPLDQQNAKIQKVQNEWKNYIEEVKIAIQEAKKKYGEDSEAMKNWTLAMQDQFEARKKLYEDDLKNVQEPFWAKMKELANSWAEDFSDTLAEAIMDLDNAFDTFQSFFKGITKSILSAAIKEKLVNPIINSLSGKGNENSPSGGSKWNWATGFFGFGDKAKDINNENPFSSIGTITTANPLPVMVVNSMGNNMFDSTKIGGYGGGGIPLDKTFTSSLGDYFKTNQTDQITLLMNAIKQVESGGNYFAKGASGEYGAYQYMPKTWTNWAGKYFGDSSLDITSSANQDKVAYAKIQDLISQGYNTQQIASIWNSGSPNYLGKVGVNKFGVSYDVPSYVNKVTEVYQNQLGSSSDLTAQLNNLPNPYTQVANNWETKVSDLNNLTNPYTQITENFLKEGKTNSELLGQSSTNGLLENTNLASNIGGSMNVTANVVNVNGGISSGNSSILDTASKQNSGMFSSLSNIFNQMKSNFSGLFGSLSSTLSNIFGSLTGLFSSFSGSSSSGGGLGFLGSLFGGQSSSAFAEGGMIEEEIIGKGLRSGRTYTFGEKENELVLPSSKIRSDNVGISKDSTTVHVPIYMQAIDTKSGMEFLIKHSDTLQGIIADKMSANKYVRKATKRSW